MFGIPDEAVLAENSTEINNLIPGEAVLAGK